MKLFIYLIIYMLCSTLLCGGDLPQGPEKAIETYRQMLETEPGPGRKASYQILMDLGDSYMSIEQYSYAIESYSRAEKLYPRRDIARLKLATAYEHSDLFEFSRNKYIEILKEDNRSFEANFCLAGLYMRTGLNGQAMEYFRRALTFRQNREIYLNLSMCAEKMGDINLALMMMRQADSFKQDFYSQLDIGRLCALQGKCSEAEQSLSRAISINPSDVEAYLILGRIYAQNNEFIRAEKLLQIAAEKDPGLAAPRLLLASQYLQQNKREAAEKEIRLISLSSQKGIAGLCLKKANKLLENH